MTTSLPCTVSPTVSLIKPTLLASPTPCFFDDSYAGLHALLIIQKTLPAEPVKLTGVNEVVKEILETTGFVDVFNVSNAAN